MQTKLPTQAHVNSRKPSADRFEPPMSGKSGGGFGKPSGGFWTSTFDTLTEDGWVAWCRAERFRECGRSETVEVWLLEPVVCRVYEVRTKHDNLEFHQQYGVEWEGSQYMMYSGIDWLAVADDYDAVRLVNPYADGIRFSDIASTFYGWDCESTLWLRWAFEDSLRKEIV